MNGTDKIIIYEDKNKKIEVSLKKQTIWLDAHKMAYLFDVDRTVIVKHIKNIYKSGELLEDSTCAKIAQVAADGKKRKMNLYNLDVIISVGYRVNSKKATQFRIWATNVLKKYLTKGYVINEKNLTEKKLKEIENTIKFIKASIHTSTLSSSEVKGFLEIIEQYTNTWRWIEEFDSGKISQLGAKKEKKKISYKQARDAIEKLKEFLINKNEASDIFGVERDAGLFKSALENIYQTFGGQELYPSFEEKAANLLYLIIKNHPFVDGNKRIGALLFLMFLYENIGFDELIIRFNNNGLTALCYLVAGSEPEQKDILINLITQMINNS